MPADSVQFFNPLDHEHIADPDNAMQASRQHCPVGRVNDILYTVNTDATLREVFDDITHFFN